MSIFLVDTKSKGLEVKPIRNMVNHETNQVFIDNLEIPAENLIGEEGKGFRYILDGLNAERILIAAECIGDGYWFIDKVDQVREGARGLRPPDRPEPGHPVPDRRGLHGDRGGEPDALQGRRPVRPEEALRRRGEHGQAPRAPRRRGKRPTSACRPTAASASPPSTTSSASSARTRLYLVAPISTNLILSYLAEHVLGLPRSF